MNITKGKITKPQKVVLYGVEGIGKSTFLSRFPSPLFLDVEGSTKQLDVARIDPAPASWSGLMEVIREFIREKPMEFSTLCLDTADWAESMCISELCSKSQKNGIEDWGYGKGYVYAGEEYKKLLDLLDSVIEAGYHVAIAAHAKMRKFEQPDELGAYDRWEMKLTKNIAPMLKEWADMVLFANYKTVSVAVDKDGKKRKAQGGKRVMYTSHHPCWDGKNRHGLPSELPFDFEQIAHCIPDLSKTPALSQKKNTAPSADSERAKEPDRAPAQTEQETTHTEHDEASFHGEESVPSALKELMDMRHIEEYEIRAFIESTGYFPKDCTWKVMEEAGFLDGYLIPNFAQIATNIENDPNRLPF